MIIFLNVVFTKQSDTSAKTTCFLEKYQKLNSIGIVPCENAYYGMLNLEICNETSCCNTSFNQHDFRTSKLATFSKTQLGDCSNFELKGEAKVSFSYGGNDELCIKQIKFNENEVNKA